MTTSPTPWLTPDQQTIWRDCLYAVAYVDSTMSNALRGHDLDLSEYEILVNLSEAPDRKLRMSDLADRSRQSRSRLTHTIARMEQVGLVERRACEGDRRGVIAALTDRGFDLLVEVAPDHVRSVREAFIDVVDPKDLEAVGRAVTAILKSAQTED